MKQDKDGDELDDLALMRSRFKAADEAELSNRASAMEAISFYAGSQWEADIKQARKADGRPAFTLNKLPAIAKQVLNDMRANCPAIEIEAAGAGATDDAAEAIQGLARHVETHSEARIAYENAFEYLVIGGFGSWRISHDYLPMSMDQELFIEPIWNPFSVYWDPASQKPDKSDAKYCFVTLDLSKDEHDEQYPDSELVGMKSFEGLGNQAPGWMSKDGVRVVEYYSVENEDATLVRLVDGSVVYDDEIPKGGKIAKATDGAPVSREAKRRTVYVAQSNGVEWLKKREALPTDDIPIVTICGDTLIVDGERRTKGMIHDLMEAQRMFNYNSSAIAEVMSLGTKANWVATAEQIEPFKEIWKQANSRNMAVLPYHNMAGVPPPQKIATEPPIQAVSAARQQSADDLRSISGVYDATQSPNGGEESGKAILARRHQASTGNNNYTGNLARGVKRTAEILLKYLPKIYDTGRVLRIIGKDQQPKSIAVHAGQPETVPAQLPDDVSGVFDLNAGRYAVTVNVGPSYDTMRQETVEMMLSLVAAEPNLAPILADLIVQEMNFPGKGAFVERLRRALPSALQDQQGATDPNQLQAHNAMLMQGNQKLMAQVQQLTQIMQTKGIESASRERVEAMKLQSAQIVSQARLDQERIKAQSAILVRAADQHVKIVHDHALATNDAVHQMMHRQHAASLRPAPEPGLTPDPSTPAGLTQ